jgi:hypothetical protein
MKRKHDTTLSKSVKNRALYVFLALLANTPAAWAQTEGVSIETQTETVTLTLAQVTRHADKMCVGGKETVQPQVHQNTHGSNLAMMRTNEKLLPLHCYICGPNCQCDETHRCADSANCPAW